MAHPTGLMDQNLAFQELVARLAAAKVENEAVRQSLIPPPGGMKPWGN